MPRTYEETAALLRELASLTPEASNEDLFADWCRKAPPRSPEHPEGVNLIADTTFDSAKGSVRRFMGYLETEERGKHFVHVTTEDCDSWIAMQEVRMKARELRGHRGVLTEITNVKRFYEWLRARKKLLPQGNPWDDPAKDFTARHRHDSVPEYRALQIGETTNLLESAGTRDFVGILTSVKLMARCSEAVRIKDTDVFLKERFIAIREHPKRKGPQIQGLPKHLRDKANEGYYMFPIDEELGLTLDW